MKKILLVSDNEFLAMAFMSIVNELSLNDIATFDLSYSYNNFSFNVPCESFAINIKQDYLSVIEKYDLVISVHCKQLFPKELVTAVRCINIHPGFNPFNRGWYPQVFSILNKLPLGATIHEIDEKLDHGSIIDQIQVPVFDYDTSLSAYNRVQEAEIVLIRNNIKNIILGNYECRKMDSEGNVNLKKDFNALLKLDLSEVNTLSFFIDKLRALTHGNYNNAYFEDEQGKRIYVSMILKNE